MWDKHALIVCRKGCKCVWKQTKAKTVPCCGGIRSNCQCRAAHRECDPEVCGSCHARYPNPFCLPQYFNAKNPSVKPLQVLPEYADVLFLTMNTTRRDQRLQLRERFFAARKHPGGFSTVPTPSRMKFDHATTKSLEIAAAKYGLGAFATQKIKKDGFIGGSTLSRKPFTVERSIPYQNMWGRFTAPSVIRQDRTPFLASLK